MMQNTFTQSAAGVDSDPTILVVDDTEDNLDFLEFALKRKPVHMLRATSGPQCIVLATEKQPDVILLDIQMPGMDGFETLKHLRSSQKTMNIPVIFLTAQRKDPTSIEHGLALGAEEYLTKPIDVDELFVRTRSLIRFKKAEAELERTKADFTAMLVHDLRGPIGGMKGVLETIKDQIEQGLPLEEVHGQLVDTALDLSHYLLNIINNMLDLSKFEAGKMHLRCEPLSTSEIIASIVKQLKHQFTKKQIHLNVDLDVDLPVVNADRQKFSQVIMNILHNALKFVPSKGLVTITAKRASVISIGYEERDGIEISLSNNGPTIPPQELPTLFERYKQASSSTHVMEKGTGLGLAICRMIVEAHGGKISAESIPNGLTTFRFTLPL
jgi:signal transduction histidine kinase